MTCACDRIEAAPESAETLTEGLTHPPVTPGRGLAMKATRTCTVSDCERPVKSRGLCGLHHQRYWKFGSTDLPPKPSAYARVMRKTTITPAGCVEFTGWKTTFGHGRITESTGVRPLAHRVVWEHHHGPIPSGMVVRHKCDNPPCVNIDHLELGTRHENNHDRATRGRNATGARYPQARMTEALVREARQRAHDGESLRGIARAIGVAPTTVRAVITGRYWSWVK